MADDAPEASGDQKPPAQFPQTAPKATRSYDDMNTGHMVFELQGTVGEMKEAITALDRAVERGAGRIEGVERSMSEIKESLRLLAPKVDDLVGFTRHRGPTLADKADLANLKLEIEKRPTRRQTVADIGWIVALIAGVTAIVLHFAH